MLYFFHFTIYSYYLCCLGSSMSLVSSHLDTFFFSILFLPVSCSIKQFWRLFVLSFLTIRRLLHGFYFLVSHTLVMPFVLLPLSVFVQALFYIRIWSDLLSYRCYSRVSVFHLFPCCIMFIALDEPCCLYE